MIPNASERTTSVVSSMVAEAAAAIPTHERSEGFARIVSTILRDTGTSIAVVLARPEGEPFSSNEDSDMYVDDDGHLRMHLKRPNSLTWLELTKALADAPEQWGEVPYVPEELMNVPLALSIHETRALLVDALGASLEDSGRKLEESLGAERDGLFEMYPTVRNATSDIDADGIRNLLLHGAFPSNWLKRARKGKENINEHVFLAQALGRLAASSPAAALHAGLHLKNASRAHQIIAVQNCVTQGLLMLRDIDEPTDREQFEQVLRQSRQEAFKIHFIASLQDEGGGLTNDAMEALATSTWISRTMPLEQDDAYAPLRDRLLREELEEAAQFIKEDRADDWARIADDNVSTAEAFVAAWDFLKHPPEEVPRMLRDAIDATRCREELEAAKRMHFPEATGAKEYEIAARVLNAVLRYPHSHPSDDLTDPDPGCCTPAYARKEKRLNCFTGPWLAAAMLLECGFDEKSIFYCDAQGRSGDSVGTHGSLMLVLESGQQLLLDVGFKKLRNIPFGLYDAATRKNFQRLVDTEAYNERRLRMAPVRAELHPDGAGRTGIHPLMFVMPMRAGFTWGSLLTSGLDALESGNVDDARHSFELAHALHPASPDILCGLARCWMADGEPGKAALFLEDAIVRCPEHRPSRYHRALLDIAEGRFGRALLDIDFILAPGAAWFGGKKYIEHATALKTKLQEMFRAENRAFLLDTTGKLLQDDDRGVESPHLSLPLQEGLHGQETRPG